MRQEWSFDAAGRVTLARNLRDGIVEGWRSFVYSGGRLVSSHDSLRGGSEYLSFDPAGRVDSIQHVDGRSTVYGYDARSRRASETFVEPDLQLVRTIGYGYDGAGRKTEIRDGLVTVLAREYRDGRVAEVRTGNGLVRTFEYEDQDEALRRVETRDSTGALRETTTVTRTLDWPAVDLDVVTTTMGGVDATTRETYQLSPFAHDGFFTNRPRVTRWTGDVGQRALDYDGRSNLIGEGATTFSFNGEGNRLLQVDSGSGAGLSYSYDEAGFATSRGGESITWAANGRITSHSLDYFSWDVLGSPISSTVGGVTSQSIFGGAVIGDAQGLPIRIDLDEVSIDLTSGGHLYRHLDLRGNVKFTSDETGATRSHYAYSPYRLEQVHGDGGDSLRFVARAEVGELMLMGARVYDPAAARFLSPDPIFQVVNQYAYTLGNPVWFHDRDGTQTTQQLDGGPDMGAAAKGLQSLGNTILLLAATVAAAGHVRLAIFLALVGQILVTIAGIMQGFAWNEPPRRRRRPTRRRLSSHGAGSWGKTLLTAA
jgi:RHS repeat-associated protein